MFKRLNWILIFFLAIGFSHCTSKPNKAVPVGSLHGDPTNPPTPTPAPDLDKIVEEMQKIVDDTNGFANDIGDIYSKLTKLHTPVYVVSSIIRVQKGISLTQDKIDNFKVSFSTFKKYKENKSNIHTKVQEKYAKFDNLYNEYNKYAKNKDSATIKDLKQQLNQIENTIQKCNKEIKNYEAEISSLKLKINRYMVNVDQKIQASNDQEQIEKYTKQKNIRQNILNILIDLNQD